MKTAREPVRLVEKTFLFGGCACAIYEVETDSHGSVFMRVNRTPYCNESRWVVIVDSERFLAAWQATPHERADLARQGLEGWLSDYKYEDAAAGFSQGKENPVPLAQPSIWIDENGLAHIDFTNGITRTIWLLAAGAKAFPVECSTREAAKLQDTAGAQGCAPISVEQLLSDLDWQSWIQEKAERPTSTTSIL